MLAAAVEISSTLTVLSLSLLTFFFTCLLPKTRTTTSQTLTLPRFQNENNYFTTDGAISDFISNHTATNDEIRLLCRDLQVLGRSEFKQLLKWRLVVRKDLGQDAAAKKKAAAGGDDDEEEENKPEDPEERLLREMSEIHERLERKKRREKKRRKELKTKARVRAAQLAQAEGIGDEDGPEGLFSLKEIKGKGRTAKVAEADVPSDNEFSSSDSDDDDASDGGSDIDSDEERLRYDATMDEYLEESYRSWKERQRIRDSGGNFKKKRQRLGMDGELSGDEDDDDKDDDVSAEESDDDVFDSGEEEGEEGSDGDGELLVSLEQGKKPSKAAKEAAAAAQWFSQDVFDDDVENDTEDEEEEEEKEVIVAANNKKNEKNDTAANGADKNKSNNKKQQQQQSTEEEEDNDEDAVPVGKKAQRQALLSSKVNSNARLTKESADGFEVVPVKEYNSGSDSDSSDDEFEGLDDGAKAEVLALAKKMLRRKDKMDLMEAAYNRYAL